LDKKGKTATIGVSYEVMVEKDGKVLKKVEGECKSFLKNFIAWLNAFFENATTPITDMPVTKADGSTTTIFYSGAKEAPFFGAGNGEAGVAVRGILVGSGTTTPTPNDYWLASFISHGTGAGQLQYGEQTYTRAYVDGNYSIFKVSRVFTNASGGDVSVNEIGYALTLWDAGGDSIYILILRDVLASTVVVPDGATLTVRYTIRASV